LIETGEGSASLIMVMLAMLAGRSLSGRGRIWVRIFNGIIGFALVPMLLVSARTPQETWAATLFASLYVVLALACAVPMRTVHPCELGVMPDAFDGVAPKRVWAAVSRRLELPQSRR
jgi:hypothetical protein